MSYSVGMDMGGTFTDGYFSDGERAVAAKVPTTHFDLTRSVMACLAEGAEAFGVSLEDFLSDVELFRLATTIGTNAVVTGTGDPVGLMVEAGAEKSLYGPSEPAPAVGVFVRADHVVGVDPDAAAEEVLRLCRDLVQQGVRQTVLSLRAPHREAELGLRELVRDRYPVHYLRSMPLNLGWETADVDDDQLRTSTAVLNAYLSRPMAKLLYRTEGILQQAGLSVPLLAARSDGACSRMARTTAISTYSSGPGRRAGAGCGPGPRLQRCCGRRLRHGRHHPSIWVWYEAAPTTWNRPLRSGASGSGSRCLASSRSAWADRPSRRPATPRRWRWDRQVPAQCPDRPPSAGEAQNRPSPTRTWCWGCWPTDSCFPADIALDADAAASALAPLSGGDPVEAARLVTAAAHSTAAAAVSNLLADAGIDPAEVTLYAFGGAGGLHAGAVAELAGIGRIRSFAAGGVYSARGVAEASVEQRYQAAVEPGDDPVEALSRLLARARLDLEAERLPSAEARITVAFDLHDGPRRSAAANIDVDPAAVAAELRGRSGSTDEVARVEVVAAVDVPGALPVALGDPAPASERGVRWSADAVLTSVVDLSGVAERETIDGPALIGCTGAVHAVPPGWTAHRDSADSLLWERSL